jgi:hypothetical protein
LSPPSVAKDLVAVVALILMISAIASAESEDRYAQYKRRGPNTRQLGPIYLTPRIAATAGWDTNVTYSQDDPFRDSTFGMVGTLEAFFPVGRRIRLIGTGYLNPNYFTSVESARSVDRGGTLRAEFDIGPLTTFGSVGTGRAKQRFSTEIDDRVWRNEHSRALGASLRLTKKLALTGSWERRDSDYEEGVEVGGEDVAQALNRTSETRSLELSFALTKRTSLKGRAEIVDDLFLGTSESPTEDEVRSYRYLGGLGFGTLAAIQGEVLVGWRLYPAGSESAPEYSGPTLEVRLLIPMVGNGLTLSAARDVYYAVEPAPPGEGAGARRNSLVSGRYTATLAFDLPFELLTRGSVQFWRSAYLLPYEQEGTSYERVDELSSVSVALLRRLGSRLALGGAVERSWRWSNASGRNYGATRYGVTAEFYP